MTLNNYFPSINNYFPYKNNCFTYTNDYFPSNMYNINKDVLLSICLPVASINPPVGRIGSFAISFLTKEISNIFCLTPLIQASRFSAKPLYQLMGKYPKFTQKILWLSPLFNVSAITAVAHIFFNTAANPYIKVSIFAIHELAVGILARTQNSDHEGFITFDRSFSKLLGYDRAACDVSMANIKKIAKIAEIVACITFTASTIGLVFIGTPPIFNSAISATASSAMFAFTTRILLALK